ncbi:MAG: ribonuclease HI [bacterium]|nr:ribonuclease HI [bacterium]MDE0290729.1 ribonuclease HI [bacterium]MDE0440033.1 ribonuclease HI [bacterium]
MADRLAVQAATAQEGAEGEGPPPPASLPAPDRAGSQRLPSDRPGKPLPPGHTLVFAEGTASVQAGNGGWAWAAPGKRYRSGAAVRTTGRRMELTAVLDAVRELEGALEVVSSSGYVVNCFRSGWWEGWLSRGWTNSQNKPVANRDLWEPLIEMYRARPLEFRPAAPADGDWAGKVEWLAAEASRIQQGNEGEISG